MTALRLINRADVLQQLLAVVAAVPAGVKLSIPQLRDALVSQADVLGGLEALVAAGELDRESLRPSLRSDDPPPLLGGGMAAPDPRQFPPDPLISGARLAEELEAYSKRHGLALSRVSKHLFGGGNALSRMRTKGTVRSITIARVRTFINAPPPLGLEPRRSGGRRVAANGGLTGATLAAELDALIEQHGLSKSAVGMHIYGNRHGVEVLRQSNPRIGTVAKVRALLANPPIEELKRRDPWATRRAKRALIVEVIEPGGCAPPVITYRKPGQPPLSFEEQLGRVERGEVGIAPNIHIGRPDPSGTLGGVTGEINL